MTLTRWSPFNTFTTLDREFRSMIDRVLGDTTRWMRPAGSRLYTEGTVWRPTVDVYRLEDELIIRCELPGIDPEHDLDVTVEGNVLHLRGQKSFSNEIEGDDLYLNETFYGSFQRDVLLPEGIDGDQLQANYEDGVLTISMPFPEELVPKAHKVPITVGGQKAIES